MRELITIEFIDRSNYSDNTTDDVVGLVIPHVWGQCDKLVPMDYTTFLSQYPEINSPGWIKADQAFKAGAGLLEVVRPKLGATYQQIVITDKGSVFTEGSEQFKVDPTKLNGEKAVAVFSLLYPGSPVGLVSKIKVLLEPQFAVAEPTPEDTPTDVLATVFVYDMKGNEIATHEGMMISTDIEDGASVNISDVLKKKSYYVRSQVLDAQALLEREKIQDTQDNVVTSFKARTASDKESYEENVPQEYQVDYGYDESRTSLPWLIVSFTRVSGDTTPISLKIKQKGVGYVTFADAVSKVGTLSDDKQTLTTTTGKYVMFEVQNDLNVSDVANLDFEVEATVKGSEIKFTTDGPAVDPEIEPVASNEINYAIKSVQVPVIGEGDDADITPANLVQLYTKWFSAMETSRSTILLPTISNTQLNNALVQIAQERSDCLAIVGYPTELEYSEEAITTFYNTLSKSQWGLFYQGRGLVTVGNQEVLDDCLGAIAGRYCSVTMSETINQIPSAQSFGAFPGVLAETLGSKEVLRLQDLGINSVYSAYTGPQIWGLKTMYSRQKSYWAKANVMRVAAYVLASTMDYIMSVIHVPNSTSKKMSIQLNRQTLIDNLIGQEVLKSESSCQCDDSNNPDSETNGGEILIIDFDLWFVKLIERVHIRIQASDNTTVVTVS